MFLVQSPALVHGNPVQIHCVKDVVQSLDGSLEVRSVGDFEREAFFFKGFSSFESLLDAYFAKIDIRPPREPVLFVPLALAMTDKYNSFHILK